MTNSESNKFSIANKLKQSVTFKIVIILFLILLLMIPVLSIKSLIRERSGLKAKVENDVAQAYGHGQTLVAPVLKIPYVKTQIDAEGNSYTYDGLLTVTPDQLNINGELETDKRKRSIYEVIVYKSELNIDGKFIVPDITKKEYNNSIFDLKKAYLSMGISDSNGLFEDCTIQVNNHKLNLGPGIIQDELMANSLSTGAIDITGEVNISFDLDMKLKGTKSLQFIPVAKNSTINIKSPWQSPSFVGSNLPQSYDITQDGFSAKWSTNQYSRPYPHYWFKGSYNFKNTSNAYGVNLIEPIDGYAKNNRTSKYALLIISLTFGVFFFFEIMFKKNIHPIQYIMIGFALTTFYLLLISLTEHIGFNLAYLFSSIGTVSLIVGYTQFIVQSKKAVSILLLLLSGIFAYIFIILQLEDFALLAGSLGLFLILSSVMFFSRNIDWYNLNK